MKAGVHTIIQFIKTCRNRTDKGDILVNNNILSPIKKPHGNPNIAQN